MGSRRRLGSGLCASSLDVLTAPTARHDHGEGDERCGRVRGREQRHGRQAQARDRRAGEQERGRAEPRRECVAELAAEDRAAAHGQQGDADVERLAPNALVTSTTTTGPSAHEIDPSAVPGLAVYCDARATTPTVAGDLRLATEAGWNPDAIIADLAEIVGGTAPARPPGRALFRSIGLGLEDAAAAALLLNGS